MPSTMRLVAVLTLGVLTVSSGSVLIRQAQEAPSLTIAFYRVALATAILLPFYARRPRVGTSFKEKQVWFAGAVLALHFGLWIASLRYTSVAVSVLLVNTAPVPAAILSYLRFGERLSRIGLAGIVLTLLGSSLLVWNDLALAGGWPGPALALGGGAAFALYLVAGREGRRGLPLLDYVVPVYATAALLLGGGVVIGGLPLSGFSPRTWLFLALLALGPQVLGHTSYNWSLRYLSATSIAILALAEPLGASVLAYLFLSESIGGLVFAGGVLILAGIWLAAGKGSDVQPRAAD